MIFFSVFSQSVCAVGGRRDGPNAARRLKRRQGVQHGAAAVTRASFVAAAVSKTFYLSFSAIPVRSRDNETIYFICGAVRRRWPWPLPSAKILFSRR